jgi:DNA-binding response OmpR family regulator
MRILVVEDNPQAAASMAGFLSREGYEVEVARDGLSAVEAARDRPADVLLLDLGLPRMDGWEVARRVQEQPGPKRPLLVAVTGHGAEEDRRLSREVGIDLHLTKPVDADGLRWLLSRFRSVIA